MLKRSLTLLLAAVLSMSFIMVAMAAQSEQQIPETPPTPDKMQSVTDLPALPPLPVEIPEEEELAEPADFYVNGVAVSRPLYEEQGVLYFPVRAFFETALDVCTVSWEDGQAVITGATAQGETLSVIARPGDCYAVANGRYLYAQGGVKLINSTTMLPLEVLLQIFNGTVAEEGTLPHITLGDRLITCGSDFYEGKDVDLLARLIRAEAGNQSLEGKIAVGNVVLNRVDSDLFPDEVYDVIYQKSQFAVVKNGTINKAADESCIIAAKLALEGANVVENALFFHRKGLVCWASLSRPYLVTIGNHDFYA